MADNARLGRDHARLPKSMVHPGSGQRAWKSFTLAARNLLRHRTRTLISLSAIAFGVVALLLAGGFIEWIFWAMREASIQTGLGHIQVSRSGFRDSGFSDPGKYLLPPNAADFLKSSGTVSVKAVDERLMITGLASTGETTVSFAAQAVDPAVDPVVAKTLPVVGERLSADDGTGILLGHGLAASLGAKQDDRVSLLVNLPGGGINAVDAHVRGIFKTQVRAIDDSAIRMPLSLGRQLMRMQGSHVWVLALDDTEKTSANLASLRAYLPADRFEVLSWEDLSDFYRKSVVLLSRQVDAVTLLIGIIIVLGISNTLTMNVLERTGEIGTLMAMGSPRRDILRLFVTEGALLGIVGGLAGLAIGIILAQLLSYIGIPMPPPPARDSGYSAEIMLTTRLALGGFCMAVISTTLASLYPAWKASRLPICDALRHNR